MIMNNLINKFSQLNYLEVQAYLLNTGWKRVQSKREYIGIFIREYNNDFEEIILPFDNDVADYDKTMYEALKTISRVENRDAMQIIQDLSIPIADIIRFRVVGSDTKNGTISFNDGFNLLESAKKMLLASACDIIQPELYHKRLGLKNAQSFIDSCRLGQTEHGSFVASIICPFIKQSDIEGYEQVNLFSDKEECEKSFTRQVTTNLMNSLFTVKSSIDKSELIRLEENIGDKIISANFLESIIDLALDRPDAEIEIATTWSKAVPQTQCVLQKIKFTHHYVPALEKVISKVKTSVKEDVKEYIGKISQTKADVDPSKRTEGEIIFNFMSDDEKVIKAKVTLNAEDYSAACNAHNQGKLVMVKGELIGSGRTMVIQNPQFKVLTETI